MREVTAFSEMNRKGSFSLKGQPAYVLIQDTQREGVFGHWSVIWLQGVAFSESNLEETKDSLLDSS